MFEEMMLAQKGNKEELRKLADTSFYDQSHMNKWFKKYAGCSPTEFTSLDIDIN